MSVPVNSLREARRFPIRLIEPSLKPLWPVLAATTFLFGSPSTAWAGDPIHLSSPPDPLPWLLSVSLLLLCLVLVGVITYFLRQSLGERSSNIPKDAKKLLEKEYAEKLAETYKKKGEELQKGLKDLRGRFTMVFMKVRQLASSLDPEEIFKGISDLLEQEMGVARFVFFLKDQEKNELYPVRWHGYNEEQKPRITIPLNNPHLLSYSFTRRTVVSRASAANDPETQGLLDREPLTKMLLAVPIVSHQEALGLIHVEAFKNGQEVVDDEDLKFFQAMSTFMGMALKNANVMLQTRDELSSAKLLSEKELEEKKRLQAVFSRYASPELVNTLLKNPGTVRLGGTQKNATILFSDIVGFTKFSHGLAPEEVVFTMNEYLSIMSEVVLNHQGEIDKFIGDAVMARFGVLVDLPSTALAAVRSALNMLEELKKLSARWALQRRECFNIRIGIATGPVLAGNIGSERRLEFTVMGNTVNLASRLEALNKELKTTILIDEQTFQQISHEIRAVPRENISIRGMEGRMTVYEVIGYHEALLAKPKIISLREKRPQSQEVAPVKPLGPPTTQVVPEPSFPAKDEIHLPSLDDQNEGKRVPENGG